MTKKKWPNRAKFVDLFLAMAVGWGDLELRDVEFDGVAGGQFDKAINLAVEFINQRNDYINLALKLGVPVEGLVADGEFGEKWAEVVALCKEEVDDTAARYAEAANG